MIIKLGNVVSHSGAIEWGAGKVVEVTTGRATIQFSDGIIRKIASSHYSILNPADPASLVGSFDSVAPLKVATAAKKTRKAKQPAV
jgi:hypothetical protein